MSSFITAIFDAGTSIVTGFLSVLISLFSGLISIFWTTGPEGTGGELTLLGTILIIGAVTPLVIWGLNWLVKFFRGMIKK